MANPERVREHFETIRARLQRDIVGLDEVIELLVAGIFTGGHCLLIGVPGLAKTLLVSRIAELMDLDFSRIQFTPDLMPSDITGAEIIVEDKETGERHFRFMKGPVFANVVLADEINRTPPKTQASMIEAMEENQVSSLGQRFELEAPFFVLATQNPIEQEGTYPLPAAQLDRFIFDILVDYPDAEQERSIVRLLSRAESTEKVEPVLGRQDVLDIIASVRSLEAPTDVIDYATRLGRATRPDEDEASDEVRKYIGFGAGPRAAQALVMGAKALALMHGVPKPTGEHIRRIALPVLRHRVILNFMATGDGVNVDDVIRRLIDTTPAPDRALPTEPQRQGFLARLGFGR